MSAEQHQLEVGIAALQAQRAALGDAVVDAALAGLQARLAALCPTAVVAAAPAPALRQVTILFLDVVGSTTLSQQLDPEETSAVMDGILRRSTAIVQAHGGRVLQYAGDSVLAAFGADEAAEDDTERAVHCGLALLALAKAVAADVLRAHGFAGLDVRVGIHTGSVLLGGGGGGAGDEHAMRGLAVNVAARMEQTAPAGALRISQDSLALVRGLFEVSEPQALRVKGVDAPVVSVLVHRARPRAFRIAARGIEGVTTPMVGRDAEIAALQGAFERLFAERRMLAVTVVAEAGIGKSRLLDEFQAWAANRPERASAFRARATPQTQGQPFGLLREVVGGWLRFSDDDTLDDAKAKMQQGLMPLFADEPAFAEGHAHLLGHLIGLAWNDSPHVRGILDDPRQIRSRALHAAAQLFRRVSAGEGAPVVVLEDLHWADDESLDFFDTLFDVAHDVPLLMLAFTRPTLFERRSHWQPTQGRHQRLDLHPLDTQASRALAGELLKELPEVPAALQELVTGRAEGNPFYMEELVRMLIDQGAIDTSGAYWRLHAERLLATRVPSTLTGVLQARLDGLPAAERATLQEASVIGPVFWDQALLALDEEAGAMLPRLVQRQLARPRQDSAAAGLREYAFQHAILHQVTYATVLRRQRQVLHHKLANWLAAQSQGNSARAGDFLGLTAQHYEEARDDANAAEFRVRAAEHAADRLAHAAALEHVRRALALLDKAADSPRQARLRWRLLRLREQTREIQGQREQQAEDLAAMDRAADALGDVALQAHAAYRRAYRAFRMADWNVCLQAAQRAVELADAALAGLAAQPADTETAGRTGIELQDLRLPSLRLQAVAMMNQGRWNPAMALLQQTLGQAQALGLAKPQAQCLNSLAILASRQNDPVRSLELHRESLSLWRQVGDRRQEAIAVFNVGAAWSSLGELAASRRGLDAGLQLARHNGDRALECASLCGLAELALWEGDPAGAAALARSALDLAVAVQARELEGSAWTILGDAHAALGQWAQAAQAYASTRRVEQEMGDALRFGSNASLARLALMQGDIAGALQAVDVLLTQAWAVSQGTADGQDGTAGQADVATANFDGTGWPRRMELTVYRVYTAAADPRAPAWLQRAWRAVLAQADAISDAALRQMFLANIPEHREILALWAAHGRRTGVA